MRDISLSGSIFTHLRLIKIWPPDLAIFHSDLCIYPTPHMLLHAPTLILNPGGPSVNALAYVLS